MEASFVVERHIQLTLTEKEALLLQQVLCVHSDKQTVQETEFIEELVSQIKRAVG